MNPRGWDATATGRGDVCEYCGRPGIHTTPSACRQALGRPYVGRTHEQALWDRAHPRPDPWTCPRCHDTKSASQPLCARCHKEATP